MQEAFIRKDGRKEYNTIQEMHCEHEYVGVQTLDEKYFLSCVSGNGYIAVRPGGWNRIYGKERFFVFPTKKELFDWMLEEIEEE